MNNHYSLVLICSRRIRDVLCRTVGQVNDCLKGRMMTFYAIPVLALLTLSGCGQGNSEDNEPFTQSTKPEIIQLSPSRPVRIELKRSSKGEYSWELKGDNVEDIIKADSRLKEYLGDSDNGGKK